MREMNLFVNSFGLPLGQGQNQKDSSGESILSQLSLYFIFLFSFLNLTNLSGQDITSMEYIMGKFNPSEHKDFVEIPIKYADQTGRYLRRDAMEAFAKMADDAAKSGIKLIIKSSTRNFNSQKTIWENKWNGVTTLEDKTKATAIKDPKERALKILLYSSMPGTSRHHWGTDIDINNFTNAWFTKGEGAKLYAWMLNNASKYGYCQVYSEKGKLRKTGYNEEKWHWSYMPIAEKILEVVESQFDNSMIDGFLGSTTAKEIDMKGKYMLGIGCD
jgi:zinc D-Ala-D-Ala carboxypeptidase